MQLYPHWNARDNYRYGQKKKKRKRDKTEDPGQNFASNFLTLSLVAVARPVPSGASKILRAGQSGPTGGDEQTKIIHHIYFLINLNLNQSWLICAVQSHQRQYPTWSARDNYAKRKKKRKAPSKLRDGGREECAVCCSVLQFAAICSEHTAVYCSVLRRHMCAVRNTNQHCLCELQLGFAHFAVSNLTE